MENEKRKYDLIVAGGGLSGTAAAISAARLGLDVLLIESSNCLGGAAVNNLVNPFMAYHTEMDGKRFDLSRGLFGEIVSELKKMDAIGDYIFKEEYLKLILNRMCKAAGVNLLFRSLIVSAESENGTVKSVTVASKSGDIVFEADYFIDATGDADLCFFADAPLRLGRENDNLCQPMTLCFRICNIDMEKYREEKPQINILYSRFKSEDKIKNPRENVLVFDSCYKGVLHFNSTRIVKRNPVDVFDVTQAEIEAREQAFELFWFLKNNFSAFKDSDIIMTASQIGVRESRMINGEYLMTGKDIVECKKFKDAVVAGNYDIDIHNPEGEGTSHYWIPKGEYYTVPYRCLIPKGFSNLLVAGRCISVDHEAQASIRIMPICCCLGEVSGVAAAISEKNNCSVNKADIIEIQRILRANGNFFGQ